MSKANQYSLNEKGNFIINEYNSSKAFSNFFPGVAGIWGIPMWAFFVNRGQCIASFGIRSKDKAVLEFQPANKSYRQTTLQGFRTFIKVKKGGQTIYWEPFQDYLKGTDFNRKQNMSMSAYDLTLKEENKDLGLTAKINYFTLPEEPYAALVRTVTIKNTGKEAVSIEMIDGLPAIVSYGISDDLNKNMARTIEAWVKVRNVDQKAPYYQLSVEVSDEPQVKHIKAGNFFFSFDPQDSKILEPIVEASAVFGQSLDFLAPQAFLEETFSFPAKQSTSNKTPSALSYARYDLKPESEHSIVSMFGYAKSEAQLSAIVKQVMQPEFIHAKARRNQDIIDEIKQFALTKSSSSAFDLYCGHTFLDNILRGGLPVSLKSSEGNVAFNVYSRKHGDLERDYNYFTVAPTFYSQGNGSYRDVNQNRRNDVWFNKDVKDSHLINFLNLSQADGYNPLIVKGTFFAVDNPKRLKGVLSDMLEARDIAKMTDFLSSDFLPGELLAFIADNDIFLKTDTKDFLGQLLEVCRKQELAEHGEGFWTDHWTYNLDLIESYLSLYPEYLKDLLLHKEVFCFYLNNHYVLSRDRRYVLTSRGVRQYQSVAKAEDIDTSGGNHRLKVKQGQGTVYYTTLVCKLLCLIANKAATLDPSGIGIEMEADKPNWYDALNGLPGLLGSSLSETLELKRVTVFLLASLKQLLLKDTDTVTVFEELATFISGLNNVLNLESDALLYWMKSNDIKEHYRQRVQRGISGKENSLKIAEIKNFLNGVIKKTDQSGELAKNESGELVTYFTHDVTEHKILDKSQKEHGNFVRPVKFKRHNLPLYLEGYVHALRAEDNETKIQELYNQVRKSDLFDKKLKMYKVNVDLSGESKEIGRTRIFPAGWLENESIWLHMEYKFILELLRKGLHDEFYDNFRHVFIPFLDPRQYGRSILENSSFIVSSAHQDDALHGQGFVARLSGCTAEFMHMWLYMNIGKNPFSLNAEGNLVLRFNPILQGELFTEEESTIRHLDLQKNWKETKLLKDTYAFNLLGATLVVYHNPKRKNTYGTDKTEVSQIILTYPNRTSPVTFSSSTIPAPYSQDIRDGKVERVDVEFI